MSQQGLNSMASITESECGVGVRAFSGIPLIVDSNRSICKVPSDFIRSRLVDERRSPQSVENDAVLIRLWIRFLESKGVSWDQASNADLLECRDSLGKRVYKPWLRQTEYAGHGLPRERNRHAGTYKLILWERATINRFLGLVFAYYVWAEEQGHIHGVVDLKRGDPGIIYRIQSKMTKTHRLKSNLLYATSKQSHRHTPIESEIQCIHKVASNAIHANRNTLILTVFEETGLRRAGALRELTVDKIPSDNQIEERFEDDSNFVITVLEKGRKTRKVSFTPRLMQMLREYVDCDRKEIVDRYKSKPGWQEPPQVFLSDRGTPLSFVAFSNIMTKVFRDAGVINASGHRLRATFLVRLFSALVEEGESSGKTSDYGTVMMKVAQSAGHARPESLRPYLELALRLRRVLSEKEHNDKSIQEDRSQVRQSEQWTRRVGRSEALTCMLRAISAGDEAAFTIAADRMHHEIRHGNRRSSHM